MSIKADIITIGDEILIGQIIDTNSAWLGRELNNIGISIRQITSISDDKYAIINTINSSLQNSDIILITGGLGPTNDDITKFTLCEMFGGNLVLNNDALQNIEHFVRLRNGEMNNNNRDQALLPDNCTFIPNHNGTASGMWFDHEGKIIVSMPGVPHEMTQMMSKEIFPRLQQKYSLPVIYHKTVIATGIAEAKLAELLSDWENQLHNDIKLAYLPSPGMVRLRFSIQGQNKQELEGIVQSEIEKLKPIIPNNLAAYNDDSIESIVAATLKEKNLTIATAESCTGGLIANRLTSIPGSSSYFQGGVVAYSNRIKEEQLNVSRSILEKHGAVSEQVVQQMSENVKKLFSTDIGISTSGIAGPDGGTKGKPVGTVWISVSYLDKTINQLYLFGNERDTNIQKSAQAALSMVLKVLK